MTIKSRISLICLPRRAGISLRSGAISALLVFVLLPGCNLLHRVPPFEEDEALTARVLQQNEDAFPALDPLALTPGIKAYLAVNVDPQQHSRQLVRRLRELLFSEDHLGIRYSDARTHTAVETFEAREGNCLSVISLYVAMARHLGIDAHFQSVDVIPRWDRRGELLVLSDHVNATGQLGAGSTYIVDFTPEIGLQRLTSSTISDERARALYFNNLGAEALVAGDYELSLELLRNALWIDPELPLAWNNIGTSFNRLKQWELAEYSYGKALDLARDNLTAANNLAKFHSARGNEEIAQRYRDAVGYFNSRNPYYHYLLGNNAYFEEKFEEARRHYQQAIRRKEVEADFWLALGLTLDQLGHEKDSEQALAVGHALRTAAAENYGSGQDRLEIIENSRLMRSSSSAFSVSFGSR